MRTPTFMPYLSRGSFLVCVCVYQVCSSSLGNIAGEFGLRSSFPQVSKTHKKPQNSSKFNSSKTTKHHISAEFNPPQKLTQKKQPQNSAKFNILPSAMPGNPVLRSERNVGLVKSTVKVRLGR